MDIYNSGYSTVMILFMLKEFYVPDNKVKSKKKALAVYLNLLQTDKGDTN